MEADRLESDLGVAADISMAEEEKASEIKTPKKRFIGRRTATEQASREGASPTTTLESGAVEGESTKARWKGYQGRE